MFSVKCLNNSSNEEENSGKRLKLESETGETEIIKAACNTPSNAAVVINTLFRSSSCKKSLKLNASAKKPSENATQKKAPADGTPNMKRAIVLGESSTSSNSPVKMEVSESSSDSKEPVKVRPMQSLTGGETDKNKENGLVYHTID